MRGLSPWLTGAVSLRLLLPVAATTALLACGSGDGASADSAGAERVAASLPADTTPPDPYDDTPAPADPGEAPDDENPDDPKELATFRGQLLKPAKDYEKDVAGFHAIVKGKGWSGWRRNRRCKGAPECANNAERTQLVVQAIHDAHKVPVALPAGNKGVVVGRVRNVGSFTDATLDIPPNVGLTRDEYYFIVEPGTATVAALKVARLTIGADGAPLGLEVKSAPNGYVVCGHTKKEKKRGTADFKQCPNAHPPAGTAGPGTADPARRLTDADALAWFSCDDGCCSAQWPPESSALFQQVRSR